MEHSRVEKRVNRMLLFLGMILLPTVVILVPAVVIPGEWYATLGIDEQASLEQWAFQMNGDKVHDLDMWQQIDQKLINIHLPVSLRQRYQEHLMNVSHSKEGEFANVQQIRLQTRTQIAQEDDQQRILQTFINRVRYPEDSDKDLQAIDQYNYLHESNKIQLLMLQRIIILLEKMNVNDDSPK